MTRLHPLRMVAIYGYTGGVPAEAVRWVRCSQMQSDGQKISGTRCACMRSCAPESGAQRLESV